MIFRDRFLEGSHLVSELGVNLAGYDSRLIGLCALFRMVVEHSHELTRSHGTELARVPLPRHLNKAFAGLWIIWLALEVLLPAVLPNGLHLAAGFVECGRQHVGEPSNIIEAAPMPLVEDSYSGHDLRLPETSAERCLADECKESRAVHDHPSIEMLNGRLGRTEAPARIRRVSVSELHEPQLELRADCVWDDQGWKRASPTIYKFMVAVV